jgi:hypothetical protein
MRLFRGDRQIASLTDSVLMAMAVRLPAAEVRNMSCAELALTPKPNLLYCSCASLHLCSMEKHAGKHPEHSSTLGAS